MTREEMLIASCSCNRGKDMMFRRSVAATWLVVACLAANASTADDTTNPSIIHAPIEYPSSAVSAREEGTVLVIAEVDTSGRAVDAKVENPADTLILM
jgi:outer membrane biosynthesis protein TonB